MPENASTAASVGRQRPAADSSQAQKTIKNKKGKMEEEVGRTRPKTTWGSSRAANGDVNPPRLHNRAGGASGPGPGPAAT